MEPGRWAISWVAFKETSSGCKELYCFHNRISCTVDGEMRKKLVSEAADEKADKIKAVVSWQNFFGPVCCSTFSPIDRFCFSGKFLARWLIFGSDFSSDNMHSVIDIRPQQYS